jgi:hypothetical protein
MNALLRHFGWGNPLLLAVLVVGSGTNILGAEPVIPGTGLKVINVGDDFEDEDWTYVFNSPKSTRDIDKSIHYPSGESENGRWYEGMKRGHPDVVKRVPTPKKGLPGSKGSLLLQSMYTGIPGRPSYQMQQDDFIADVYYRLGTGIPVSRTPSVVVRVFLPPADTWENRTGVHFGFRTALLTTVTKPRILFSSSKQETETYWTGMFIEFESKTDGHKDDYAYWRLRADERGTDFRSKQITTTGWWTIGLSVTPDGMAHYYASPGVDDLTPEDHLTSQFPYGYRAEAFKTFFFNVCSGDDGKTWSTPWIIDDPTIYVVR